MFVLTLCHWLVSQLAHYVVPLWDDIMYVPQHDSPHARNDVASRVNGGLR
jgi:hypothetical protein